MIRLLSCSLLSALLLTGCGSPPARTAATPEAQPAAATASSDVEASGFGQCKSEAAARNLPLPQHQEALFDCARRHAGKRGEACMGQMILGKIRVSDMEREMAYCLKVKSGT